MSFVRSLLLWSRMQSNCTFFYVLVPSTGHTLGNTHALSTSEKTKQFFRELFAINFNSKKYPLFIRWFIASSYEESQSCCKMKIEWNEKEMHEINISNFNDETFHNGHRKDERVRTLHQCRENAKSTQKSS